MSKKIILLMSLITMVIAPATWAKDLSHRLGVGPKTAFSFDLPSLSASYYPYQDFGVVGAVGINTDDNNSRFGIMAGVRRIVFEEQMMNFYFGGNFSVISVETMNVSQSGYELSAVAGGEFFLHGLDNLGFQFESGVGIVSLKGGTKFVTIADTPIKAGVIFYF
jgi:hypothetical protein